MALWNYVHDTLHTHVYILLSAVLLVVLAISSYITKKKSEQRVKDEEKVLEELRNETGSGAAEAAAPVTPAGKEAL